MFADGLASGNSWSRNRACKRQRAHERKMTGRESGPHLPGERTQTKTERNGPQLPGFSETRRGIFYRIDSNAIQSTQGT